MLVMYESGSSGRGWKGERVEELLAYLRANGPRTDFVGLRGLRGKPYLRTANGVDLTTAVPGLVSRLAARTGKNPREARNKCSRIVFQKLALMFPSGTVLTQSTLGSLVEKSRRQGRRVIAECDMTCPAAWRRILLEEANKLDAMVEVQAELPPASRIQQDALAFEHADHIVVFSDWALKNLPSETRQKAELITPVSISPQNPIEDAEGGRKEIELIFVGQLNFRKGFHILANAVARNPELFSKVHVFGGGRSEFLSFLKRQDSNASELVEFHGEGNWRSFVQSRPARYMAVLPSLVEGSPRFIFEASSMAIPSIVSEAAKPSFLEAEKSCLQLSELSPEALTEAVVHMQDFPSRWLDLSAACHQAYKTAYTDCTFGQGILRLVERREGVGIAA